MGGPDGDAGQAGDLAAHRRAYAVLGSHGRSRNCSTRSRRASRIARRLHAGHQVRRRRGDAAPISVIEFTGASEAAAPRKKRRKTDTREHQHGERRAAAAAG